MREQLKVYLVTGRYDFSDTEFLKRIETACRSGVTLVQLREKEVSTRRFYELAVKVKVVTDAYQIPLIINDRVDICLAVDAAGVHIGMMNYRLLLCENWLGPQNRRCFSQNGGTRS